MLILSFINCVCRLGLQDFEHLGISNCFKNLAMMFPLACFMELPMLHFRAFVDHMTRLTCSMGKEAAKEEAVCPVKFVFDSLDFKLPFVGTNV